MADITLEEVEAHVEKVKLRQYKPEDRLRRYEAAQVLSDLGYPVTYDSLAALVTRRAGPPYYKFGKYAFYKYGELIAWAEDRMRRGRVG
jgi:hypothetical protein